MKINANAKIIDDKNNLGTLKDMHNDIANRLVRSYSGSQWVGSQINKINTKINVNAGSGGAAYLLCFSGHTSSGDATNAAIYLLRCGYSGDNYKITPIITSLGTSSFQSWSYEVTNGELYWWTTIGYNRLNIYKLV